MKEPEIIGTEDTLGLKYIIKSKSDYLSYLKHDKIALGKTRNRPRLFADEIWKFERLLRKTEYYYNCKKSILGKFMTLFYRFKFHKLSIKLGFYIPINCFGPGLSIAHYGNIVVNDKAKIGKNCRIQEGTNIGTTNGTEDAPVLGDNVFIGTGAKIIGKLVIGDNVAIGANAFVNKSFAEGNMTIAGIPAKKISDNTSYRLLSKSLRESDFI